MNEKKRNGITWTFIVLTILIVAIMMAGSFRRPERIQLPAADSTSGSASGETDVNDDALTVVEVTPETVQVAIGSLSRPESYSRRVTVEQIWSGGSSTMETEVSVQNGWTRTDRTLPGGQVRHTVTDGATTYIWYNSEETVFETPAGIISADTEQMIPTYEDILALSVDTILAADYRTISDVNCIYVETVQDPYGYAMRYWVSVDTGLLVAAEKLLEDEAVYRMAALKLEDTVPTDEAFVLPDGRALITEE